MSARRLRMAPHYLVKWRTRSPLWKWLFHRKKWILFWKQPRLLCCITTWISSKQYQKSSLMYRTVSWAVWEHRTYWMGVSCMASWLWRAKVHWLVHSNSRFSSEILMYNVAYTFLRAPNAVSRNSLTFIRTCHFRRFTLFILSFILSFIHVYKHGRSAGYWHVFWVHVIAREQRRDLNISDCPVGLNICDCPRQNKTVRCSACGSCLS